MEKKLEKLKAKQQELLEKNRKFNETLTKLKNYDLIFDDLTALLNKNFFSHNNIMLLTLSLIEGMIINKINNNNDKTASILYCDINGLKMINDTFGHTFGDIGIKKIADIIKKSIRMNRDTIVDHIFFDKDLNENMAIRIGGDEFLVILPNCTKEKALETVVKRIKDNIDKNLQKIKNLSLSIGISDTSEMEIPDDFSNKSINDFFINIVKLAEERMYEDKQQLYKKSSLSLVKNTIGRLSEHLNLNLRNEKDFQRLITIIEQARKDMYRKRG